MLNATSFDLQPAECPGIVGEPYSSLPYARSLQLLLSQRVIETTSGFAA